MRALYIFDLDGTLRNLQHRLHHLQSLPKNYEAFHGECVNDTEIAPVCELARFLGWVTDFKFGTNDIWIWTGAAESSRAANEQWLNGKQITYSDLRMRPEGDHTKDHLLKQKWLHTMSPEDRKRLVMVFEDRQRVVVMWRANGVTCAQIAPGDF